MKNLFAMAAATALMACGAASSTLASAPASTSAAASTSVAAPASPSSPASPSASPASAAAPAAPTPAPAASAPAAGASGASAPAASAPITPSVTTVSNEITTPTVIAPDKVIATLRPQFNACYQDGLKKDPKLEGSVTLSAKIEKDGKVSAVTPKNTTGLNAPVIKCLTDRLKAAVFAPAGGMNYTTSLDIPVGFSSH